MLTSYLFTPSENILGKGSEIWAILERIGELSKVATKSGLIRLEVISFQEKLSLVGPEVAKLRKSFVDVNNLSLIATLPPFIRS